jgi:spore coat polysaccharide biosynthesis protein SpsF
MGVTVTEFKSPQEDFWAGTFGVDYIQRNSSPKLLASNIALFTEIFRSVVSTPGSFLEIGANVGMNIMALQQLFPNGDYTGIEINAMASNQLRKTGCKVINSSVTEVKVTEQYDCVLTKGVLIHVAPEQLPLVYKTIYEFSKTFILIAEYYSPNPIQIKYRGHDEKLFKRDFAGEFMDLFPDVVLRDYGFTYHRGLFPQDDINWFLLEKSTGRNPDVLREST